MAKKKQTKEMNVRVDLTPMAEYAHASYQRSSCCVHL